MQASKKRKYLTYVSPAACAISLMIDNATPARDGQLIDVTQAKLQKRASGVMC